MDPDMMQPEVSYSISDLKEFTDRDPNPVIAFYGGEPLLRIPLLKEIMDKVPAKWFMLQTNAIYLDQLEPEYTNRLQTLLVSIDGRKFITDHYRSNGVYDTVVKNVHHVRDNGFDNDLIARMAISRESDIFKEVTHLLGLGIFDHIHWQLDVFWSEEGSWDIQRWIDKLYNPGITKLVDFWYDAMCEGIILGFVPFQAIMKTLLRGETTGMRCGAGSDCFAITTTGDITICPICPDFDFANVGNIHSTDPEDIRDVMAVGTPCPKCEIYGICGGRCLFANHAKLWSDAGFEIVCGTVKHLVSELVRIQPGIEKLIENGTLSMEDFEYPLTNNCCEIIP